MEGGGREEKGLSGRRREWKTTNCSRWEVLLRVEASEKEKGRKG